MQLINKNLFIGCLGHFLTHQTFFILLFSLAIKQFNYPHPFNLLIWMTLLMFTIGLAIAIKTIALSWSITRPFFPINVGPMMLVTALHCGEWICLVYALYLKVDMLSLVLIFSASETFFSILVSKYMLGRYQFTWICIILVFLISASSIFLGLFIEKQRNTFKINFKNELTGAYILCLFSKFCQIIKSQIYKKALLSQAAFDRYKAFKLSPFRLVRLSDLNENGEISKPVVSENSVLYKKAQYILNERNLLEQERLIKEDPLQIIDLVRKSKKSLSKEELQKLQALKQFLKEQEMIEKAKVNRHRGITERYGKLLFERNKNKVQLDEIKKHLEIPSDSDKQKKKIQSAKTNSTQKLESDEDKVIRLKHEQGMEPLSTAFDDFEGTNRDEQEKREWALHMSDEIQELIKDYKFLQLHEHLFDGNDDAWLSRLDEIFDSAILDQEMVGQEVPQHFIASSIYGGLLALPFYVIMGYFIEDSKSFIGILRANNNSFYSEMMNQNWQNIIIIIVLMLLYALKPITTTNFVLSIPSTLTYVAVELMSKSIFTFITIMAIEKRTTLKSVQAFGLIISFMLSFVYQQIGDSFKNNLHVQSACQQIKSFFGDKLKSVEDIENLQNKLNKLSQKLSPEDAYRVLLDTIIANDMVQLDYPTLSVNAFHKMFDQHYTERQALWGSGLPRPSYEYILNKHIVTDQNDKEIIRVKGELVHDMSTFKKAREQWSKIEGNTPGGQFYGPDYQSHMINSQTIDFTTMNNMVNPTQPQLSSRSSSDSDKDGTRDLKASPQQASEDTSSDEEQVKREDYDIPEELEKLPELPTKEKSLSEDKGNLSGYLNDSNRNHPNSSQISFFKNQNQMDALLLQALPPSQQQSPELSDLSGAPSPIQPSSIIQVVPTFTPQDIIVEDHENSSDTSIEELEDRYTRNKKSVLKPRQNKSTIEIIDDQKLPQQLIFKKRASKIKKKRQTLRLDSDQPVTLQNDKKRKSSKKSQKSSTSRSGFKLKLQEVANQQSKSQLEGPKSEAVDSKLELPQIFYNKNEHLRELNQREDEELDFHKFRD